MGKKKPPQKAHNLILTPEYLENRTAGLANAGYEKPKWIGFCQSMMAQGYKISLYEAQKTVSKYVTVIDRWGETFKVRFSNHKPIQEREANGDCDFFVGRTNFGVTNTYQAELATLDYFRKREHERISQTFNDIGEREIAFIDD